MTDKTPVVPVGAAPATAEHFRIASQKPAVKFLSRGVQPPSQVYVTNQDDLCILCSSSLPGEVVTVNYRLLRFDGELVFGQLIFPLAAALIIDSRTEGLTEGFLLSVSCRAKLANQRGQTFIRIYLTADAVGQGSPSYVLFADYVTFAMAPAHPNGRVLAPTEGPGNSHIVTQVPPGAGAQINVSLPSFTRWRIQSFFIALVTTAAAGNRNIFVLVSSAGSQVWSAVAPLAIPPSMTGSISGTALPPSGAPVLGIVTLPIPPNLILVGPATLSIGYDPIYALDQLGSLFLLVEEWLDGV